MRRPEQLEFSREDPGLVLERMASMAHERDGWINLEPDVVDEPQETASLFGIFSASGPRVPMCTWIPGRARRNRIEPTSIGLQHGVGSKVVDHLRGAGLPLPDGWRIVQDHPKRGLVALVPDDASPRDVVEWLTRAASELSERDLTGRWRALIYR